MVLLAKQSELGDLTSTLGEAFDHLSYSFQERIFFSLPDKETKI